MNNIDEIINSLSLEEKIGQLFVVRPDALCSSFSFEQQADNDAVGVTEINNEIIELYNKYPCGGFALFPKNVVCPDQLKKLTSSLHSLGKIRPLICIDEEGGTLSIPTKKSKFDVTVIARNENFDVETFPCMGDIALSKDSKLAYKAGKGIGSYLKEFGIDVDFGPVADVNSNPNNKVIGRRAFGSDPVLASEMVREYVKGLHDNSVCSCIKHFPGHGDTNNDSHLGYAETNKNWIEMEQCEMLPFISGINEGSEMVMIAHIATPNLTGNNKQATLSYEIVSELLRNKLHYDGVIITDSMAMNAITDYYNSKGAALEAIKAGIDLVLMPVDYIAAFNGVKEAVLNGEISEERINYSLKKIMKVKKNFM